ncbi:hypothetical protein RRU01S_04_01400 [Agrobacterium rubi TR3 = NBRC 13261]|uniref:Uncharacterized protein n=1 Tax=Agrobacterium rubi TR3 = NBRC 13261 TaxID=1368415 RepID=A0A081CRM2_9HYPH|nr:hypothetical protein [Agrobacterium rubi]GAK69318.1 hypothetical protein RRU01S_04_01400 [Agrobacterium rubi TR3 = NBRC 13261]
MKTFRDALRADIEEQFELPHMPPPMTVKRAQDFTCEPNSSACDECRRLLRLKTKH